MLREGRESDVRGRPARRLGTGLVVVGSIAALAASAALAGDSQGAKLKVKGPQHHRKSVTPGKSVTMKANGFPADERVSFTAAIDGPAAFSGRGMGQDVATPSGKAVMRKRLPSKYKYCNADLECETYRWPKGAKLRFTASSDTTYASKVVRLKCAGRCLGS